MKVNELRIGNLLYTNNEHRKDDLGKVVCVVAIDSERSYKDKSETVTIYNIDDKWKDTFGQWIDFLKPIPLTEKWLLKFGFISNGWNYELGTFKLHAQRKNELGEFINNEFSVKDIIISFNINYIHQLQNLYFALTNKEL